MDKGALGLNLKFFDEFRGYAPGWSDEQCHNESIKF